MHSAPVIVNNTPLVALWTLDRLDLLRALFGEVLMPGAVYAEFLAAETLHRRAALAAAPWIQPARLHDSRRAAAFIGIGLGEAEVLSLAQEQQARLVIIDDRRARRYAMRLSMPLTGTLGVLLAAKAEGHVPMLGPLLARLQMAGLYFAPSLIENVLSLAGESAPAT